MHALTRNDRRELRFFALGLALVLVVVFWWFLPWFRDRPEPLWPLIVAWFLVVIAWAHPPAILPLHRAFLPVARVLAWLNTWLLLGTVFFAMLLPLGWVLRRLGKLQYVTGFDARVTTYRVPVPPEHELRLKEPF
ncbi:MAG: putative rane protein [Steroidobacteraceae bacterium]|nr:putative rane protein [Steroidobacteraceae bacterium]